MISDAINIRVLERGVGFSRLDGARQIVLLSETGQYRFRFSHDCPSFYRHGVMARPNLAGVETGWRWHGDHVEACCNAV